MEKLLSHTKNYEGLISGISGKESLTKKFFLLPILFLLSLTGNAQNKAGDLLGNYVVPSKDGAIQIYESNGKYHGKIISNKDASKLDLNIRTKKNKKEKS